MSYKILFDDRIVYSLVATTQGYTVIDADITYELNKAPTLVFTLPPTNPMYDEYTKMKTVVTVTRNDELIFRGRILNTNVDFYKLKEFTCEGDFAFFNDSVINAYTYGGTVYNLVKKYVDEHNAQVDAFKQFEIGEVTVTDNNNYVTRSNIDYVNTLEEMNDKLIDEMGGYLSTETSVDANDVEHHYLNYTTDSGDINSQVLSFNRNIVDLEQFMSGEDLCTVLVPLGAKLVVNEEETDERLTVASVNNGSIYIQNDDAVAMFGRIVKSVVWEDVTVASNLLTKGRAWLNDNITEATTISLNAVDLSIIDIDSSALKLGEYNRVYSRPHGIDDYFQLSKMVVDLVDPSKNTYTFGYVARTLTDSVTKTTTKQSGTVQEMVPAYWFDFTKSLKDSVSKKQAELVDATRNSSGVHLDYNDSQVLMDISCKNKTAVIETGSMPQLVTADARFITFRKGSNHLVYGLYYRKDIGWSFYNGTFHDTTLTNLSDCANATIKFVFDGSKVKLSVNDNVLLSNIDLGKNLNINFGSWMVSLVSATVKSLKIYDGEY